MCRIIFWRFECENCNEHIRSETEEDPCDIALGLVDGICVHLVDPRGNHRALLVRCVPMEQEQCATCKDTGKDEKKDNGEGEKRNNS